MRKLVTGKLMKALDERTSAQFGVPPVVLMEQAALAFTEKLMELYPEANHILVVCGRGNNGGDGIAIARLLNQSGRRAAVCVPDKAARASELFSLQWEIYAKYGYPVTEMPLGEDWDCVVDAMFGTGLSRAMGEPFASLTETLNGLKTPRVSVDIASGVSADDGQIPGAVFHADYTITFSFGKLGSYLYPGAGASGEVLVLPIGITEESMIPGQRFYRALESKDLSLFPGRVEDSNKGTYGRLLVIAGSRQMAGAAVLAAEAAYRCGCGLVKVVTPEENRSVILEKVPEAILSLYGERVEPGRLKEELDWATAVVVGPGLGTDALALSIVKAVLENGNKPLLLDADALNLIAAELGTEALAACGKAAPRPVITPHPGEMARLTGRSVDWLKAHVVEAAETFAGRFGCVIVLKGSRTVTAMPQTEGGETYINLSGNSGMSTAGSGDVLTGVIGALLARGTPPGLAAPLGVYLHGLAGDRAAEELGMTSVMASDIIHCLSGVLRDAGIGSQWISYR